MPSSLDEELNVPASASLNPIGVKAILKANSASIPVGPESLRARDDDDTAPRRSLLVGRQAATADLRIQHGSISRKHAVLYYNQEGSLTIKDLGGKHGTSVNDERIPFQQPIQLKHGDRILFGNVQESIFQVELEDTTNTTSSEPPNATANETLTAEKSQPTEDILEKAGEGLTGRAKRQAEIAAMMSSLDQTPTYQAPPITEKKEQTKTAAAAASVAVEPVVSQLRLPVSQTFRIPSESGHRHAVTALAVDPSGNRFVVGVTDQHLRYYDFAGMNQGRNDCFRNIIPDDGHWPVSAAFSGDRVVVGTGSVQPIVLDREGTQVVQFVRGDMYVTDKAKTMGHTSAVTAVDWHPLEREWVLTASLDGSARLWDVENGRTQFKKLVCDKVFSPKTVRGQRTGVTAACFHPGGREFALGTACGSVQIWSRSRVSGRPERAVFAAHGENKPITALVYNMDGSRLASRSVDDTEIKVWNQQRLSRSSAPVVTCQGAPTVHEHANMAFCPKGKTLCATVADSRDAGRLQFYNVSETKPVVVDALLSLDTDAGCSPVIVKWHPRTNQLFVGCSDGQTLVLYDPKWSKKGALLAAGKVGRAVDDLSALLNSRAPTGSAGVSGEIVTPFSLPMYRKDPITEKKRKRQERKDPIKSKEPERPETGKHRAGRQAGGSTSFALFVADQRVTTTKPIAGKDPREALFKYNKGKSFVNKAYEGNESKLAEKTAEEEEAELKKKSKT